jgi:uncharacterized ferredoxin-like protein
MINFDDEMKEEGLLASANLICIAARTAPKGKGRDLLTTVLVTAEEKLKIADKMREIALRDSLKFFARDAENVDQVHVMILLGTRESPLGLPNCGYCGFSNCDALLKAGGVCSFNSGDLGIALGSAVSRAADLRIDNRILYSAGKAAVELGMLGKDVRVAFAIPLSATGKNPFFDRK